MSTFSGKVLGFTGDPAARDATGATMADLCPEGGAVDSTVAAKRQILNQQVGEELTIGRRRGAEDANIVKGKENRFKSLKAEVSKLKADVAASKEKYAKEISREGIAVKFKINFYVSFKNV